VNELIKFSNGKFCFVVDNSDVIVPYPYPSDPKIAEQFYEEFIANKNKPPEANAGKGKTEEKVR
jgi:hypothetical protein